MYSSRTRRHKALNADFCALEKRRRVSALLEVISLAFACDRYFQSQLRDWTGGNRVLAYVMMEKLRKVTFHHLASFIGSGPKTAACKYFVRTESALTGLVPDSGTSLLALCSSYLLCWDTVIAPALQKKFYAYQAGRGTLVSECQDILRCLSGASISEETKERFTQVKRQEEKKEARRETEEQRELQFQAVSPRPPSPHFPYAEFLPVISEPASEKGKEKIRPLLIGDKDVSSNQVEPQPTAIAAVDDDVPEVTSRPSWMKTATQKPSKVSQKASLGNSRDLKTSTGKASPEDKSAVQHIPPTTRRKLACSESKPESEPTAVEPEEIPQWKALEKQKWRPESNPFTDGWGGGRTIYKH